MAAEGIIDERVTTVSRREAAAGCIGAVVTIAVLLPLGMLGYSALGAAAVETGVPAAFVATAIGGLVVALRARSSVPAASLSAATTLIVAGVVAELAADPAAHVGEPGGIALVICAVSLAVIGMGLLQIAFALMRLGSVVKFVPQSAVAGLMTGVAVLILIAQVPTLLGLMPGALRFDRAVVSSMPPATLAVGLATAAVVWLVAQRWPRAPGALLGLLAGTVVDALLRHSPAGLAMGALAGAIPAQVPLPAALMPLLGADAGDIVLRHLPTILTTSLLLALVGSLESVLGAKETDFATNRRHDANADLLAFGFGNVASGVFGGLPVVYQRARAAAILQSGGRTWRAAAIAAVASGTLFLVAGPLLALLPLAVLAGIMLTIAFGLVDRWTRRLVVQLLFRNRTREVWKSLAIAAFVCGITLWQGFVGGIAAGIVISIVLSVHALDRKLVRARHTAMAQPSLRAYARNQERALGPLRARITIVALEGALYFGNVDRLQSECDALPGQTRYLVLDLSRVTSIDATGAMTLVRLTDYLAARPVELMLAGVSAGNRHGRALLALGEAVFDAPRRWFPDVDHAVEVAERRLLSTTATTASMATIALENCSLAAALSPAQVALVRQHMREFVLPAGETLFREGDAGDSLFVLTKGSVTLLCAEDGPNAMRQRFVSFSPGMMFGEVALLERTGRAADAVADTESTLHELTRASLDALHEIDPDLCARLNANIALHLAGRLRVAAAAWSANIH